LLIADGVRSYKNGNDPVAKGPADNLFQVIRPTALAHYVGADFVRDRFPAALSWPIAHRGRGPLLQKCNDPDSILFEKYFYLQVWVFLE
jgi:hypothetical protein